MGLYTSLDDRNEDLRERLSGSPDIASTLLRRYEMSWLYHENALEGIVLSEIELQNALEHQSVADASLMQIFTVIRNHRTALERIRVEVENKRFKLSVKFIEELYDLLIAGIPPANKDKIGLRREMPLHRTYFHDIYAPDRIPGELDKLVEFTKTPEFKEFHPVKQATYVHWQLMQVFPYTEQSGRIARLLQTFYLLRGGYMPAIVHAIDRQRYYDSLRMPLATLRGIVVEAIDNSLENATKFMRMERARQIRRAASE